MLFKTSVDEVFMHHFEKIWSASGGFVPPKTPTGELPLDPDGGLPSFRPPHCPPLKKILRASMVPSALKSQTNDALTLILTVTILKLTWRNCTKKTDEVAVYDTIIGFVWKIHSTT